MSQDAVRATYDQIGVSKIRPLRNMIFAVTEVPPEKEGSIVLPPQEQGYFGGDGRRKLVEAVVIAAGPYAHVEPGEKICFYREHFTRWKDLPRERKVGWISENDVVGFSDAA